MWFPLSLASIGTWHGGRLRSELGRQQGRGMDGVDGWMEGWVVDSDARAEVHLFFPQLVLHLDSGHSRRG